MLIMIVYCCFTLANMQLKQLYQAYRDSRYYLSNI